MAVARIKAPWYLYQVSNLCALVSISVPLPVSAKHYAGIIEGVWCIWVQLGQCMVLNKTTNIPSEIINYEMWQFLSSPMQHAVLWFELSQGLPLAKNV